MLDIETQRGNMYAWDDNSGLIIPSSPIMKIVINEVLGLENISNECLIKDLKMVMYFRAP
jgi:hypothetical protein